MVHGQRAGRIDQAERRSDASGEAQHGPTRTGRDERANNGIEAIRIDGVLLGRDDNGRANVPVRCSIGIGLTMVLQAQAIGAALAAERALGPIVGIVATIAVW
jgi:hypothetical protein